MIPRRKCVGVTASRDPLTSEQRETALRLLRLFKTDIGFELLRHGDCVNGDEFLARVGKALGYWVIGHPPEKDTWRAHFKSDETWKARPYLDRNHDIVDFSNILLACPKTRIEQVRSGTWSTIRYARKVNRLIVIIYPDGSVSVE